jgi:hypothetical protein
VEHQLRVHRTVSGAQASSVMNSLLSRIHWDATTKIDQTVRCAPDCPVSQQRPHQRSAARFTRNQRATRGQRQRSLGCTGLSGLHRTVSSVPRGPRVQRLASLNKERNCALFMSGGAPDCPVRQRTEGKNCLSKWRPFDS